MRSSMSKFSPRKLYKVLLTTCIIFVYIIFAVYSPLRVSAEDDLAASSPELLIRAINPGYTMDKVSNTGEFIELVNLTTHSLSLAGFSLKYTNSSGNTTTIYEFPAGTILSGESLLMRYYKSPESASAHLTYRTSLAMSAGPLSLYDAEHNLLDSVCWTGKDSCVKSFSSKSPTTLVRDLETLDFSHFEDYAPSFVAGNLYLPPDEDPDDEDSSNTDSELAEDLSDGAPKCRALEFNEILTYYADNKSEQFIELYNPGPTVNLEGCALGYKKKTYPLSGTISSGEYYVYRPTDFALTKNPTSENQINLIDADGQVVDELIYPHGQKKLTTYARFFDADGVEDWRLTYAPTPGATNEYQEFRSCADGQVINPATGYCVKATSLEETTKVCPEGKYLNPLTNRCKNIESESTLKPCAEGYERNPETNRCRKVTAENDGASFAIVPTTSYSGGSTFVALGTVILIVSAGVIYIVFQFRREIARTFRKARERLHHITKNLVARKIRRHRDKET